MSDNKLLFLFLLVFFSCQESKIEPGLSESTNIVPLEVLDYFYLSTQSPVVQDTIREVAKVCGFHKAANKVFCKSISIDLIERASETIEYGRNGKGLYARTEISIDSAKSLFDEMGNLYSSIDTNIYWNAVNFDHPHSDYLMISVEYVKRLGPSLRHSVFFYDFEDLPSDTRHLANIFLVDSLWLPTNFEKN